VRRSPCFDKNLTRSTFAIATQVETAWLETRSW
jgi:hypothetical protein